ncbi:MAG: cob(I)yrinic acid a,c-diamide adenosyltransferase [Pirellulales bacterium]|nr:cob(I)yrinic acid a,c-diamide adenosyltransferase [Pirellulales bacterium]
MDTQGYVHVYTGDGKGKTTAALGLALRAAGAGWRVFFAQFVKGATSSELAAIRPLSRSITVRQFGRTCFIDHEPEQADFDSAEQGLIECEEAATSGEYRLVVLDEANVATTLGLLDVDRLLWLIDRKHPGVEIVITGRWAHRRVIERADLVTEMQDVKHYYRQGVSARTGIES